MTSLGETPADVAGLSALATTELRSVDALRESILKRIMRVGSAVGLVGVIAALTSPKPYDKGALLFGAGAAALVFAITFIPMKRRILSIVYPWALVCVGTYVLAALGYRADALLLVAGGLFIGSLALNRNGLLLLVLTTSSAVLLVALSTQHSMGPSELEAWTSAGSAMLAVVLPAAIAGRMLVNSLSGTLVQREELVQKVLAESRALESAMRSLEKTRVQLTHAQKVELIGQMAGGIAHDMNNALTTVMGQASLMSDDVADEREAIVEAASYAAQLTRQLMVFGRRDISQPRPLDLGVTVQGFLSSIRRLIPSDILLDAQLPEYKLVVIADPTQLLQVLLNLASNAKDAMLGGGNLSLRLTKDQDASVALIEVSDTGTGIAPESLSKIFDPFYTTKAPGYGTGLGLANVWQLMEGLGGSVDVRSELGVGTTFTLRLPLTDAELKETVQRSVDIPGGSGTVLVVDDDVRIRAVVYTALQRIGYRVIEATSAKTALELAREQSQRIDLVLTDVVMAGGGGAEVISVLRQERPEIRVLVMSGYPDDESLRRGVSLGEFPFIAKPFTAAELAAAVHRAMGTDDA